MSGRRRGRPVVSDQVRKDFTLSVRFTNEERSAVEGRAVSCGMTASNWIRHLVFEALISKELS